MKETFPKNNGLIEEETIKYNKGKNNLIYEANKKSMPMIPLSEFEDFSQVFENHNNLSDIEKREANVNETAYLGKNEETSDDNQLPLTTFFPEDIEGSATIEPRFKKIMLFPNCGLPPC